jgi:hypothetical protein
MPHVLALGRILRLTGSARLGVLVSGIRQPSTVLREGTANGSIAGLRPLG